VSLLFLFVQFEFTHAVGPHAARYVVEPRVLDAGRTADGGDEAGRRGSIDPALDARNRELADVSRGVGASDVLVIGVLGAPAGQRRLLRKTRTVEADAPPTEVPLSLVTFVKGTEPLTDERRAAAKLDAIRFSEPAQEELAEEGLAVLNLAIRGYRAGARDPYASEVTRRDARRVRIGYGNTEDVQDGAWRVAFELPPALQSRSKRIERLRPAEAVAAVLSGRTGVLEGEDLLLRALIDLDQGRTRAAAQQVAAALRLLPNELGAGRGSGGADLNALAVHAGRAEGLARSANEGRLGGAQLGELESLIDAVCQLLDTWRYRQQAG
jgi:hypothetical protein